MSTGKSASGALQCAAIEALHSVVRLNGAYEGPPLRAAVPYAIADTGPETDWGHKTGEGREVRLAITIRDEGERPARLREIAQEAETALTLLPKDIDGWRIVSLIFLRGRIAPAGPGQWAGVSEYRVRMLRTD